MKFDKILKIIWFVNGIIILLFLIGFGVLALGELFRKFTPSESQVIVGEELQKAKDKGLVLQGLDFDDPSRILGASGYLLPIKVRTYENPQKFHQTLKDTYANSLKVSDVNYSTPTLNIIFLNSKLESTHVLLEQKGIITGFRYPGESPYYNTPPDTLVKKYITYEIGYDDSNKDGLLNDDDNTDLYFTDLEGRNLTQITNNLDVRRYYYLTRDELIIIYVQRNELADEHKKEYLARYNFTTNKLEELSSLQRTLDQLEKTLIQ